MTELEKWFDVVTQRHLDDDPMAFHKVDLIRARRQIGTAAQLTQPPKEPFSSRDNHGTSGQTDSS